MKSNQVRAVSVVPLSRHATAVTVLYHPTIADSSRCQRRPSSQPRRQSTRLHPLPLRIMHWINAVAIFIMIGSGWKIYNDDVIFGFLHFPDSLVIGKWAQYGLQWHFFGMWIFVLNGLCLSRPTALSTGRFRRKLFPDLGTRDFGDRRRCIALSPEPRRSDALQRRAEDSLSRRHAGRHLHRDFRPGAVEAGAVFRTRRLVRQFSDHPAGPFPVHGGDRRVSFWFM